jgi:hypothetical protein
MDFETSSLLDVMRLRLARLSAIPTGDRLAIMAGDYEGEGVTRGAGLCQGAHVPFIFPQDHARNRLLHTLYAPRKRVSSTLRPLCGHRYARHWI